MRSGGRAASRGPRSKRLPSGPSATATSGKSDSIVWTSTCRNCKRRRKVMVVRSANTDSFVVTTPSETEIRMTRVFNAPRQLVFEAMSKPEHVKRWWGRLGEGYSVPVCEIDLRPGGKWRFVNRHPKGEAAFHGEYREITPPSRIV